MASFVTPFSSLVHVHKSLSNEMQVLLKIAELGMCMKTCRESLSFIVDSVFEQSLVNDSSANTAVHLLRKPVRTDLLFWIDGKLQLKHAPAANYKNSDIHKIKNKHIL